MPGALETNVARYCPLRSPVHCIGTSTTSPPGPLTFAVTCASLISTNVSSTTSAVIATCSPASTRSADVCTSTGPGTPSTSQRRS